MVVHEEFKGTISPPFSANRIPNTAYWRSSEVLLWAESGQRSVVQEPLRALIREPLSMVPAVSTACTGHWTIYGPLFARPYVCPYCLKNRHPMTGSAGQNSFTTLYCLIYMRLYVLMFPLLLKQKKNFFFHFLPVALYLFPFLKLSMFSNKPKLLYFKYNTNVSMMK